LSRTQNHRKMARRRAAAFRGRFLCSILASPQPQARGTLRRGQDTQEALLQGVGCEIAVELSVHCERHRARFLGDDHDDCVGGLAQSQPGAMSGAQQPSHIAPLRQRQQAPGGHYALAPDHRLIFRK
jgi:hypothetical protein